MRLISGYFSAIQFGFAPEGVARMIALPVFSARSIISSRYEKSNLSSSGSSADHAKIPTDSSFIFASSNSLKSSTVQYVSNDQL